MDWRGRSTKRLSIRSSASDGEEAITLSRTLLVRCGRLLGDALLEALASEGANVETHLERCAAGFALGWVIELRLRHGETQLPGANQGIRVAARGEATRGKVVLEVEPRPSLCFTAWDWQIAAE